MPDIERVSESVFTGLDRFDDIIDVRTPHEFDQDHLPGAVNLPVLSNEERAEVGTIYVQDSRFRARRIGAASVSRNIADHIAGPLANKPSKYRPMIYCWRGGMRSNAMATILSAIGWRVAVLEGGYKTWRRKVVTELRDDGPLWNLILIDGQTGSAKTALLNQIADLGLQTLDLERLANHRGSVFGGFAKTAQPTQKLFETRIWHALSAFDRDRPVFVEAESAKIGQCGVPPRILQAMRFAPRIEVQAPADARAHHLIESYPDLIESPDRLAAAIDRLHHFHSKDLIAEWQGMAAAGNFHALAVSMITHHYDPAYDRQRSKWSQAPQQVIKLENLNPANLAKGSKYFLEIERAYATKSARAALGT